MARRKTSSGETASASHGSSKQTSKRERPQQGSNTTQKAIIGILNAAEGHLASVDGSSTCLCIVLKENSRSEPYKSHPFNLAQILGEKWNNRSTYRDIFGEEKPSGEKCKATFCELFGLEPARVDIKEKWTLVFALQEDGTIDTRLPTKTEPPDWVAKAVKAAKDLSSNPTPSAVQSPSLSENMLSPQKKQKTSESEMDKCIKVLSNVVAKDDIGPAKAVLDDLALLLDGKRPAYSNSYREERKKRIIAGTLFVALLTSMDGASLVGAMSHLWLGRQKCMSDAQLQQASPESSSQVAQAASASSAAASALGTLTNLPIIESDMPIPDEVAQCITERMNKMVDDNGGKAVELSPAMKMAYGAMSFAQTAGCWDAAQHRQSRVIEAKTGRKNNHSAKVWVMPTERTKADPRETAETQRYKNMADEILGAMQHATQIAVINSAIRNCPNDIEGTVGPVTKESVMSDLRFSDEVSEAIAVYVGLSTEQERKMNRAFHHAKKLRPFSPVNKRKKATKARCALRSSKFDKVKLKERVKGTKGKVRNRHYRRYSSSMIEIMSRDISQLANHFLLQTCEQRLNKPEWNDSIVYGIKIDRGGGSIKVVINNICVAKPQSLGHTKLIALIKLAKDTYENLRDGLFSPDDELKGEAEDLLNNKCRVVMVKHNNITSCAIARHNGEKKIGNCPELPKITKTIRISDAHARSLRNKQDRFDFEKVDSAAYLSVDNDAVGIAYYGGTRKEIGRVYFNEPLKATGRTPHLSVQMKQKRLRGFLSADFELLSNVFGHVGANAMRSCLWCEMWTREYLKFEDRSATKRTRANIYEHYRNFSERLQEMDKATERDDDAKKKYEDRAHQENGSIRAAPLLDIDPSSCICMPLHIILGITKKLNEFFLKCIEAIDDVSTDPESVTSKKILKALRGRMVRRLRVVRRLIIETAAAANPALNAEVIQADLANVTDKSPTQKNADLLKKIQYDANAVEDDDDIKGQVDEVDALAKSIEDADDILRDMVGPFELEYFNAKKAHGVDETVYHHDFVGNDCVKFTLKYAEIFAQVKTKVEEEGNEAQKALVRVLIQQSKVMWKDWAALVRLMRRCNYLEPCEIEQVKTLSQNIPKLINEFVATPPVAINLTYPQQVKLHCLAALHLYDVAKTYNTIGILSEESGESIHNKWNSLVRRFANRRGVDQEKGAVLELERSQEPKNRKWIEVMEEATARYTAQEKEDRKLRRNGENNENNGDEDDDEGNNDTADINQGERNAIIEVADDDENDDGAATAADANDNDDDVLEQCPHCPTFYTSRFLSFHIRHTHPEEEQESVQRLEKVDL